MMLHLELISLATESDQHAVVIVAGAGWHTMDTAMPFSNLTLRLFPKAEPDGASLAMAQTTLSFQP
ncbi:hypothetical protein ACRTDR_20265, partial [Shewanella algae]